MKLCFCWHQFLLGISIYDRVLRSATGGWCVWFHLGPFTLAVGPGRI